MAAATPWADPWWWNSYPYSFGFFAWDPFWYGASYPVYGGYGYGGGYGYDAGYGYGSSGYGLYGGLKLKVKPRDAEVLVDGYFVGRVDDFDGLFQKLNLESGPHRIEIRAPGYETLSFDVRIEFDETVDLPRGPATQWAHAAVTPTVGRVIAPLPLQSMTCCG